MDESGRKITKIAREAGKFTLKMMKEESRRHTGESQRAVKD